MTDSNTNKSEKIVTTQPMDRCPHCGVRLSSWEQVLLNVDHALMCKNCWYRIILDVSKSDKPDHNKAKE